MSPKIIDRDLVGEAMRRPDADAIATEVKARPATERERRAEFYDWLDENRKAEFIDGEIVVHSPVRKRHADATTYLTALLHTHTLVKGIGFVATEKILVKLTRNDFEPDVAFWRMERAVDFEPDQLFFPAPDLVAEVLSPGTEGYDRGTKFKTYAAEGVAEYWIVDAERQCVEVYALRQTGTYGEADVRGLGDRLTSGVAEGFGVPVAALFDRDAHPTALRTIVA